MPSLDARPQVVIDNAEGYQGTMTLATCAANTGLHLSMGRYEHVQRSLFEATRRRLMAMGQRASGKGFQIPLERTGAQ